MEDKSQIIKLREIVNQLDLAKEHIAASDTDESFFIFDCGNVVRRFQLWKELFPRIVPHFAYKSNDHKVISKIMAGLGAGFDCASKGEIRAVLSLGVCPDRIVFAQTVKPVSHVNFAKKYNVKLTTFDNVEELYKMKKHYPDSRLLIRLAFEPKTNSDINFAEKFGCSSNEAVELMNTAKDLGLNVAGVCFHIGIGCIDYNIYTTAIMEASQLFAYGRTLGFNMDTLDIGGGFSGKDCQEKENRKAAGIINSAIEEFFPDSAVKIISEPGQFFADQCYLLAVNVHSKKIKKNATGQSIYHYYVTDGIYQSFSIVHGHKWQVEPKLMEAPRDPEVHPTIIWGRACDPYDVIVRNRELPELSVGDWIVFANSGGYRTAGACDFNGFERHPIYGFISVNDWKKFEELKVNDVELTIETNI